MGGREGGREGGGREGGGREGGREGEEEEINSISIETNVCTKIKSLTKVLPLKSSWCAHAAK